MECVEGVVDGRALGGVIKWRYGTYVVKGIGVMEYWLSMLPLHTELLTEQCHILPSTNMVVTRTK